jgi:hypothetical protein
MDAPVKGNNQNGNNNNNFPSKKVEPLLTVADLKKTYLFGIDIKDQTTGTTLPDLAFQRALDTAIGYMETYLDISISPIIGFQEYLDYRANEYQDFGYLELSNFPVAEFKSLELVYFRDVNNEPITVITMPNSWIRLNNHDGIIRLLPNANFPAQLALNNAGLYYPELLQTSHLPAAWRATYDFGFCSGGVPVLLNNAIGMMAAMLIFIYGGHLYATGGPGISSTSISLDGLSQSVGTTASAENSLFSASIGDYKKRLYGEVKDDPLSILYLLKSYYKGAAGLRIL